MPEVSANWALPSSALVPLAVRRLKGRAVSVPWTCHLKARHLEETIHASRVEAATRADADEAKDSIKRERVVLGPWSVCTARPTGMRWHGQLV